MLRGSTACPTCEEFNRQRYARPGTPQEDLSITQCPGKNRPAHWVMQKAIGVNGFCVQCEPPPAPRPPDPPRVREVPSGPHFYAQLNAEDPGMREQLSEPRESLRAHSAERLEAKERWAQQLAAMKEHARVVREQIEAQEEARRRERSPAEKWLLEEFRVGKGEVDAGPTIERAREAGITEKQLRTARENLDVRTFRPAYKGGWRWILSD